MAEAHFYLCDVCCEQVPKEQRFFIATDRIFNGIENVTEGDNYDLCGKHLVALIQWLLRYQDTGLRRPDYDKGKDAVNGIETLIRHAKTK